MDRRALVLVPSFSQAEGLAPNSSWRLSQPEKEEIFQVERRKVMVSLVIQ